MLISNSFSLQGDPSHEQRGVRHSDIEGALEFIEANCSKLAAIGEVRFPKNLFFFTLVRDFGCCLFSQGRHFNQAGLKCYLLEGKAIFILQRLVIGKAAIGPIVRQHGLYVILGPIRLLFRCLFSLQISVVCPSRQNHYPN